MRFCHTKVLTFGLSFVVVCAVSGSEPTAHAAEPGPENAFAVTGSRKVGGGRLYPPFYSYVIGPHAVVEKGTVFCAFQNTASGRQRVRCCEKAAISVP